MMVSAEDARQVMRGAGLTGNCRPIPQGAVFGLLTVVGPWRRGQHSLIEWLCRCSCGGEVWRAGARLRVQQRLGHVQSCGCRRDSWGWGVWRSPNGNRAWWEQRLEKFKPRALKRRLARFYRRRRTDRLREGEVASPLPDPEQVLLLRGRRVAVVLALSRLTGRRGLALALRFGLGGGGPLKLEEVGALMGVTRQRACQLEHAGLRELRRRFGARLAGETWG